MVILIHIHFVEEVVDLALRCEISDHLQYTIVGPLHLDTIESELMPVV